MLPLWLLIALQALLALLALHWWSRAVMPNVSRARQPELVLDVWAPVAIIIPMLFTVRWMGHTVEGGGWVSLGGPIICGAAGVACALLIGDRRSHADRFDDEPHITIPLLAGSVVTGLTLLLLGAAHTMNAWIGQCAFALGAILLWINTPDLDSRSNEATESQQFVSLGMLLVLLCAAGQGLLAWNMPQDLRPWSAALLVAQAVAALGIAAWTGGQSVCVRIALWAATLGVLFALGVIALTHIVPRVIAMMLVGPPTEAASSIIARGFGAIALEAAILLILAVVSLAALRLPRPGQKMVGASCGVLLALLALVRLSAI